MSFQMKKCSVIVTQMSANSLAQYEAPIIAKPKSKSIDQPNDQDCVEASGSGWIPHVPANVVATVEAEETDALIIAQPKHKPNDQPHGPDHVVADGSDCILLPITPPAKRSRRLVPCLYPNVFDDIDDFQENDANPVIRPVTNDQKSSPVNNVNGNGENIREADELDVHADLIIAQTKYKPIGQQHVPDQVVANTSDGILLPITPPGKRSHRLMVFRAPFVSDNTDEFQENDANPVIRPVMDRKNSRRRLAQTSSTINLTQNKENESAKQMNDIKSTAAQQQAGLAETPENQQMSCLQCSAYKKEIAQLKKNVQRLKRDARLSKQSFENELRNLKHDNNHRQSEYLQQIDELQDKCVRLISENSFA